MIRFSVFDNDGPAADWPLRQAHVLGADDAPVRGRVTFEDGLVTCRAPGKTAMALALQYDAGSMGDLVLQTCLLPRRDEPYVLSVELARHRIKTFIVKSEEWQMFDLSVEHHAFVRWNRARQLLTRALTTPDARAADEVAREALATAIDASERLCITHAELLLHRRFAARPASSTTLGVRVGTERDGRQLREVVAANFDLIVLPIRWRELEIEEGVYAWDRYDRWMEWATAQKKPIVAGPLLDFSRAAVPEWMYVWQHDYGTCRDLVYEYMEKVVSRYKGAVGMWNIASGINVNDNFKFTQQQMLDLTRTASLLVRQARRGARTMIELREPFGEYAATNADALLPIAFVDRLIQEGIKFDALGVQMLFGQSGDGRAARDLMQISSMLDRYFLIELPILVSALGVPSEVIDPAGGTWHDPWSPDRQAKFAGRSFAIVMSKPFIESVFWCDLYDHEHAMLPGGGLIDERGQPKPSFARLVGMRRRLRKPLGPAKSAARARA